MKKALSIVLSIAVMLSMCVGFSIVASADAVELPGKPYGAENFAALSTVEGYQNNTAPLPEVDEEAGTIVLGGTANGTSRAEFDLEGLTAEDDYVISFQASNYDHWFSTTWGLQVCMSCENGSNSKTQSFVFAGTNAHQFVDSADNEIASFSKTLVGNIKFDIYVDADTATNTRTYHVFVGGEWVYSSEPQPAIEPQLGFVGSRGGSNSWTVSNLSVYKVVTDFSSITPAGKDVNLALDPETSVSLVDKTGDAVLDATASISFTIKEPAVNASFAIPAGALDDEFVVAFNAEMSGGWESSGVLLSFGENAVIKVAKAGGAGGELYFNDQLITSGNEMRTALIAKDAGANIVAHVKTTSGKSDIAFYMGNTLLGTMEDVTISNTITIGSIAGGYGDKLVLRNIKVMNNTDLVPTPGSTTPSNPTTPSTPGSSNTPSNPTTPSTPGSSNTPSNPTTPSTPGSSNTPSNPTTPSTPGSSNTPSNPTTPSNPGSTTPSQPGSSDQPTQPTQPSAPEKNPADKNVNIATLDEVQVTISDKKGTAIFDKANGSVKFPDHLDAPVGLTFDTAGLLADRYIVSFTAKMHGGWESNGVQFSWGSNASVKLIKAHAKGGQIIIGDQTVDYDGIRGGLITGTGEFLAYVYPSSSDATKSNVDIYLGSTKIATMKDAVLSDTITIGSVCGAWGDMLEMTNIKIMNNPALVPGGASDGGNGDGGNGEGGEGEGEGNEGGNSNGPIVNGVDTDKKGTGKDIEILAPADPKDPNKNLADVTKLELPDGATLADGVLTLKGGVDLNFDLSAIKATDDYIIKFKMGSLNWWPHEYMNITFGQSGSSKYVWTYKGNAKPNGAADMKNEFAGVSGGTATKQLMAIQNNTIEETEYVIYVTTSPESGKRRIFFFANNKPLLAVNEDGTQGALVIEDQDVLDPCLTFRSFAGSAQYQIKDIAAYVAEAPKFKEALIDKEYTTPPIPNADAKNWAELDKAVLVGAGEVKEDGKIIAPGGEAPASSVTIPLGGLTKEDGYVISFMTTTCSYDDWQSLTVTIGQEGEKNQKFVLRGSTAYSGMYLNGAETRIKAMAAKGSLTKIDIMVCKSVETGNRRIVVFQDGQVCVMYNAPDTAYETKAAELIDPVLTFAGGKNGTFEITNLKVYKLSDTKGWTGNAGGSSNGGANTGNPSQAAGALAVTAAIALPVIFFARKKKED